MNPLNLFNLLFSIQSMYESNSSIELHALTITGSIFGLNDNSDAIDVAFGRDKLDLFFAKLKISINLVFGVFFISFKPIVYSFLIISFNEVYFSGLFEKYVHKSSVE